MIEKNVTYSQTKNVTVANFGHGSIQMIVGSTTISRQVLLFKSQEPHPIGSVKKHGFKNFDDMKPDVVFQFSNPESVDALIDQLTEIKNQFKKTNNQ